MAIEVDGLVVRYGDRIAVDHLSFTAARGAVTALLGPNGAGKTSTVETIEGYRRPDAGSVRVLGLDPVDQHAVLVPRIGVMLQSGGVYSGIRPLEILRLYASYYDDPVDPAELLELVGLADRARSTWRSLSGGEQQRLSLALALVGRPEVAFLDEPTAGVDPAGRQVIRRIVADLRDRGVTVLLTSHDLDEVERLADHVVIIDRGVVLAEGTPAELVRSGPGDDLRFGAPVGLDTAALSDGHHELRVVGIRGDALETQGRLVVPFSASNHGRSLALTVQPETVGLDGTLRVSVAGKSIEGVTLFCNGRVIGRTAGQQATVEIPADVLGAGRVQIRALGRAGPGAANAVSAAPATVDVRPAK